RRPSLPAGDRSDGLVARLAGADAVHLLERGDEDLAVADFTRLRGFDDRLDHALGEIIPYRDLDLDLRQEVDDVLGASIELRVSPLPPEALDLRDGHALDAHFGQRVADIIQSERLDDRGYQLH